MSVEQWNQIENAAFLLLRGNLARLCLSSDLVSFDYKTAAKYVRIPGHRQFIVLRDENLGGSSVVQAPFRSNALAVKLMTMPTVTKSIRLTKLDMQSYSP